ncbi:alpha-glucosidase C-terminal domain-containing protein, partial [Salinactinospora qingdaonensis]|uniref:alpha-glucosidase C-terminal domain-containing protein n=1 Tax=Salinactinospora qingdaonensis TaxID=702744 RepID=UPI0031E9B567
YLPLVMDPIYGYQALNVEAQRDNPGSLLNWMRKMIQIRKRHPVFGTGDFTELHASNPSVLAFVREYGDDRMLCVNNLSRFPQPVELDLRRFQGVTPIECTGGVRFPAIGELSYLLTLPGHGFYWFQLPPVPPEERTPEPVASPEAAATPTTPSDRGQAPRPSPASTSN